jgi:hypothetical protein
MFNPSDSSRELDPCAAFFGVILLLASTVVVHPAHEKHGYAQALVTHRQSIQVSQDKLNGVDQAYPDRDALTKRIEQDTIRLDRLIEICPLS